MNNVLAVANTFGIRPSEVIGMQTVLGQYLFDSACVYYIRQLEDKKVPRYIGDEKSNPGLQSLLGG